MINQQTYRLLFGLFFAILYISLATQPGLLLLSKAYDLIEFSSESSDNTPRKIFICSGSDNFEVTVPRQRVHKKKTSRRVLINGLSLKKNSCSSCDQPKGSCCCSDTEPSHLLSFNKNCDSEDHYLNIAEKIVPISPSYKLARQFNSSKKSKNSLSENQFYEFSIFQSIDKVPIV